MIRVGSGNQTAFYRAAKATRKAAQTFLDGAVIERADCRIKVPGANHILLKLFYGRYLTQHHIATSKCDIEAAAQIQKKIPRFLDDAFLDFTGVPSAQKNDLLHNPVMDAARDVMSGVKRKLTPRLKNGVVVRETTLQADALPPEILANIKKPIKPPVDNLDLSNDINRYLVEQFRKDGVKEELIRQFLNHERPRMYRFIGQAELDKLMNGQRVTSSRPCHGGNKTDITSNPNYGKIFKDGKYRITYKDMENFAPFSLEANKSRVQTHALEKEEFYLHGGYSLDDVEKIELYSAGNYATVYSK